MWRTPATLRDGTLDDVPGVSPDGVILALETSCDDTCAAVVSHGGEIRVQRHLLAGRPRPLRRRRARGRLPPPPRAGQRRRRRRAAQADAGLDDVELVAVTRGPGPGRRAAGRASQTAKGLAAARRLPLAAVDHLHGHVAANFLAAAVRAAVPVPDRLAAATRCCARVERPGPLRGARPHARRRRRRGVRQGRAHARPRLPGRPRARAPGPRRRPGGVRLPDRQRVAGLRLLLRRAQDGAALHACATSATSRAPAPTSPPPTSTRSSRRSSSAAERALERDRPDAAGPRRRRGRQRPAARARRARSPTRSHVPPMALCTDNAAMIARAARYVPPLPYPEYLGPRRLRDRGAGRCERSSSTAAPAATCATTPARCSSACAGAAVRGARHRGRRRAPARATSSASRSSRSTARSCSTSSWTRRLLRARARYSVRAS